MKINPKVELFSDLLENGGEEKYSYLTIYGEDGEILARSQKFAHQATKVIEYDGLFYLGSPDGRVFIAYDTLIKKFEKDTCQLIDVEKSEQKEKK